MLLHHQAAAARAWPAAAALGALTCRERHASKPVRAAAAGSSGDASSLAGKAVLITGSTDGIGRHTATKLAAAGATVLVHGRSAERVARTVEAIQAQGGSSTSRVQGYVADLSSLAAVRQLARAVSTDYPRLHALVNNAGVFEKQKRLSEDGFELTWAVNVLAPFLLTSLLWQRVEGQVITTASISAASHLDMANLQQERGYSAHDAYSLSKLCDIAFTLQLAQRLQAHGSSLKANTLDPGTVNTKMLAAGWGNIGIDVGAADNTYRLLTERAAAAQSGKYYVGGRAARPPSIAEDAALQQRLWELWQHQTGAVWAPL